MARALRTAIASTVLPTRRGPSSPVARFRRRLRSQAGYSIVELLGVMSILVVVLTAVTTLFVQGSRSEIDLNKRFQAQQEARVAVDRMRREIHCANAVTLTSASSITVTLPAACPASGGVTTTVTWDTSGSASRYKLRRNGVALADYLTDGSVFTYTPPNASSLGLLVVNMKVNLDPAQSWKLWNLTSNVALRNSVRA